jgi:hypothetical protein
MHVITYGGRPAAVLVANRICLIDAIAALELDHPVRRWIVCKALFAQDVLDGLIEGPITASRAECFARSALIPDHDFILHWDNGDATLAEHFNVPLEAIGEKRIDLAVRPAGLS